MAESDDIAEHLNRFIVAQQKALAAIAVTLERYGLAIVALEQRCDRLEQLLTVENN